VLAVLTAAAHRLECAILTSSNQQASLSVCLMGALTSLLQAQVAQPDTLGTHGRPSVPSSHALPMHTCCKQLANWLMLVLMLTCGPAACLKWLLTAGSVLYERCCQPGPDSRGSLGCSAPSPARMLLK